MSCVAMNIVNAAEYFVSPSGDNNADGSSAAPFATIDKAIEVAVNSTDIIYVESGEYTTVTQWGPSLKAKLIGMGETRNDVIIKSSGQYRTLRMAANSWLENVTIIGEGSNKADKGGAIEMNGGTVKNCVIKNGTATASGNPNGGNIYMAGASVVDGCEIFGGTANKRGGNVYVDGGTLKNSTIYNGQSANVGGNIYQYAGTISNCVIYSGTSVNDGGNIRMNGACLVVDCTISDGHITTGSNKKGANVYMDSSSKMSRCRLIGGTSDNYDSGSLCMYSSSASVENCLITRSACGGALLGATSYIYNTTIVGNNKWGVWSWNKTHHIYNTIIYGNTKENTINEWTGDLPSSAEYFQNCASSDNQRLTAATFPTLVVLSDNSSFTDFENGDYTPTANSALIDSGVSDPRGPDASTTDLNGAVRLSGVVDIGCFEYQKQVMTVRLENATYDIIYAPATVTFTHLVANSADIENVSVSYDFGDGSENAVAEGNTISHTYTTPGIYTVSIVAKNECEEEYAEMTYEGYIRIAADTIYVTPGNKANQAFPYNTPETGYGSLKEAVQNSHDGYTLLLGEGVHETSDQISFNKAITIRGQGQKPDDVIVRNTTASPNTYYYRTLEMNNANGRIENITIENGCVKDEFGGNLRIVDGIVSNCIIRGGLALVNSSNSGGAGVLISGKGILTHCIVSNNTVRGTSSNGNYAGGAIMIAYNAKNGRVSNSLIAYNTYECSGDLKSGAAGIRFVGSNDNTLIENNTIVSNVVIGALTDDSAGVHCTTWYGRLRNNIIMGNYETLKEKFTSAKVDTDHCTYLNNLTDNEADVKSIFKDFNGGDFTINPGSLAYNKGTDNGTIIPSVDLAGNARIFSRSIDIGCYECQLLPGLIIIIK